MDRILVAATNKDFPRISSALTNSGTTPESAPGGTRPSEVTASMPPKDAGSALTPARRPRVSVLKALAAVALWDTKKFDTMDIAHVLGLQESQVTDVLAFIREERRARA